ncbi:MAG: hypothetical protein FD125_2348 [bacterium]|nr:MAG: hypothetical protein FD125_2348 [bacterium]
MMSLILSLAAALTVAPAPTVDTGSGPYAPGQTEFVGWVRFASGEFQLYADEDQVLQPFSRPCVSGAGSRNEMRQAMQDLGGQKVRIVGRTVDWSEASRDRIEHNGSVIRNDCGGSFVVVADDIRPAS